MPPDTTGKGSDLETVYHRYFSSLGTSAGPRSLRTAKTLQREIGRASCRERV